MKTSHMGWGVGALSLGLAFAGPALAQEPRLGPPCYAPPVDVSHREVVESDRQAHQEESVVGDGRGYVRSARGRSAERDFRRVDSRVGRSSYAQEQGRGRVRQDAEVEHVTPHSRERSRQSSDVESAYELEQRNSPSGSSSRSRLSGRAATASEHERQSYGRLTRDRSSREAGFESEQSASVGPRGASQSARASTYQRGSDEHVNATPYGSTRTGQSFEDRSSQGFESHVGPNGSFSHRQEQASSSGRRQVVEIDGR